jgi:hypothetical protein
LVVDLLVWDEASAQPYLHDYTRYINYYIKNGSTHVHIPSGPVSIDPLDVKFAAAIKWQREHGLKH